MSTASAVPHRTTVDALAVLSESPASLDVAVRSLLGRLMVETHRANQFVHDGNVTDLQALLETRDVMLSALDRATQAMQHARDRSSARFTSARAELATMTTELQRANGQLLRGAQLESVRLSAALKSVDRPDRIESAYRSASAEQGPHLDRTR